MSKKRNRTNAVLQQDYYLQKVTSNDILDLIEEFEESYGVTLIEEDPDCLEKLLLLQNDAAFKVNGTPELIEATGDPDIEMDLDALKGNQNESGLEYEPIYNTDAFYYHLVQKQAHMKRRASKVNATTRAIKLGSDAIFKDKESSPNLLLRQKGTVFHKAEEAKRLLSDENKKKITLSQTQLEELKMICTRSKRFINTAKKYEEYTMLYMGKYFKHDPIEVDPANAKDIKKKFEVRHKKYEAVLYDTKSLFENEAFEKGKRPDTIRINRYPMQIPDRTIPKQIEPECIISMEKTVYIKHNYFTSTTNTAYGLL